MSEPRDDADLPRDAWLREALRHAPDADAAPPAKLNETILRMGRAAVAPREERKSVAAPSPAAARPPGTAAAGGNTLASLWAWLTRPPVAAGFAVVFLSTVVGVMWMGRPLDEALPPREEAVAGAPPAPVVAQAPAQAPAEQPRDAARMPEAAKRAAPAPAAAPAAAAPAPVQPAAPPVAAPAAPAAADMAARESATAERRGDSAARMAAAAPAPMAAPAPAQAIASAIETPSLSNLRFEIRRKPETWSWQRDDGESRAMNDAMQEWIALADRTARPAWQHGAAAGATVTTTLRFTRDGTLRAVLRIGPTGLQLTRGGKTESVELSRAQLAALQASLDALGP